MPWAMQSYGHVFSMFHRCFILVSLIDGMVGWIDGRVPVLNTKAISRGVTVLPTWQDGVWCVDVVTGSVERCWSDNDGVEGQAENFCDKKLKLESKCLPFHGQD